MNHHILVVSNYNFSTVYSVICTIQYGVHLTLYGVQCTAYIIRHIMYGVRHIAQSILYVVQLCRDTCIYCTSCIIHRTLYVVRGTSIIAVITAKDKTAKRGDGMSEVIADLGIP